MWEMSIELKLNGKGRKVFCIFKKSQKVRTIGEGREKHVGVPKVSP